MFLASDSSEESNHSTRQQTIARKGKQKTSAPAIRKKPDASAEAPITSFLPKEEEDHTTKEFVGSLVD